MNEVKDTRIFGDGKIRIPDYDKKIDELRFAVMLSYLLILGLTLIVLVG